MFADGAVHGPLAPVFGNCGWEYGSLGWPAFGETPEITNGFFHQAAGICWYFVHLCVLLNIAVCINNVKIVDRFTCIAVHLGQHNTVFRVNHFPSVCTVYSHRINPVRNFGEVFSPARQNSELLFCTLALYHSEFIKVHEYDQQINVILIIKQD